MKGLWLPQVEVGGMCHYKGKHKGFLKGHEMVVHPVCGDGYANSHMQKFIELYTYKKRKSFTIC